MIVRRKTLAVMRRLELHVVLYASEVRGMLQSRLPVAIWEVSVFLLKHLRTMLRVSLKRFRLLLQLMGNPL